MQLTNGQQQCMQISYTEFNANCTISMESIDINLFMPLCKSTDFTSIFTKLAHNKFVELSYKLPDFFKMR